MIRLLLSTILLASVMMVGYSQEKKPLKKAHDTLKTKVKQEMTPFAVIETNMGTIEIELFEKAAPKTVKNFIGHSENGYYNGVVFHRVIDDFMIQGGDPTGTGRGGESIYGEPFEDEIVDTLRHTGAGILSMANRGPNTNGSQFFITLVATPWLDGKHTVFGKVVKGLDVVKAIGKVKTSKPADRPLTDVVMQKVTIVRK